MIEVSYWNIPVSADGLPYKLANFQTCDQFWQVDKHNDDNKNSNCNQNNITQIINKKKEITKKDDYISLGKETKTLSS